jgi:hypothetical protein
MSNRFNPEKLEKVDVEYGENRSAVLEADYRELYERAEQMAEAIEAHDEHAMNWHGVLAALANYREGES